MSSIIAGIAVARSADKNLQLWAANPNTTQPWTRWGTSPAGWTSWQLFPIPLPIATGGLSPIPVSGVDYLFASQLPGLTGEHLRDSGRMQLWVVVNPPPAGPQGISPPSELYTIVKSSEHPNAPWMAWENFGLPTPSPVQEFLPQGSVVSLSDGRLQVWSLGMRYVSGPQPDQFLSQGSLWSRVQTTRVGSGYTGTQDWSGWKQFPNLPTGWTFFSDPTSCELPDGGTQLWVIGQNPATAPLTNAIWTCVRKMTPGNLADPLSGWGAWSELSFKDSINNGQVRSIRAVADGKSRAYLWFSRFLDDPPPPYDTQSVFWYYTYTAPGPSPTAVWSAPILFPFPVARDPAVPRGGYNNSLITLGVLPNGGLQLFLIATEKQLVYPIHTTWQEPPQPPTKWFSGGPLPGGWTDFSIP